MDDFEVLKECKQAYEILNDLADNCTLIGEENGDLRENLFSTMGVLADLYQNAWELLASNKDTYKLLETNIIDRFGNKCIISDLIGYAYLDTEKDENMYAMECEVDIKSYKFEDFDNVEQAKKEYINIFGETRQDIEDLLNNEYATDIECDELIKDIVECLNGKLANTNLYWWK